MCIMLSAVDGDGINQFCFWQRAKPNNELILAIIV